MKNLLHKLVTHPVRLTGLGVILLGSALLYLIPYVWGWAADVIVGGLFATFLARHSTLFYWVEQLLRGGYTLLALGGLDFLFLLITYTAINTVFERGGSKKDIAGVSFRALKGLLVWQVIIATAFLVFFGKRVGVYVYNLIPPFLTQSGAASVYMMLWELSLLLFAFGYALMEDGIKAVLAGGMLAIRNFIILFTAAGVCIVLTWFPGLCLSFLHVPTWVLVLIGVTLHTVFFNGLIYVLLKSPNVSELFEVDTK